MALYNNPYQYSFGVPGQMNQFQQIRGLQEKNACRSGRTSGRTHNRNERYVKGRRVPVRT